MEKKMTSLWRLIWSLELLVCSTFLDANSVEIVVGVVCGEHCEVPRETISAHFDCVTVIYHRTETANIFDVFDTVRQLDNNASLDIIILMLNNSIVLKNRELLHTHNKPLVVWGEVPIPKQQSKIQYAVSTEPCDCGDLHTSKQPEDETCALNMPKPDIVERTLYSGPAVVTALMEYVKWKYIIVLYEDATVFEMSRTLDLMSRSNIMCSLFHIDDLDRLWADLVVKKNLYYFTVREDASIYFLVLCRKECAKKVLTQANVYDAKYNSNRTVLRSLSRWIFALYGEEHDYLKYCGPEIDHVLVVPIPEIRLDKQSLFIPSLKVFLRQAEGDACSSKKSFKRELEKMSSEINVRRASYPISTLAWTSKGREFITVGYIKSSNGQVFLTDNPFPNINFGYNRRQFHVSVIVYPPFVIKRIVNGTAQFSGFCIDILLELSRVLNFTHRISEVPDGNYGVVLDRDSMRFNGLIGQVQRSEVDMIVGDIGISKDREQVMDFTFPFYYGYGTVLFKRPNGDGYKWRKLADPLKWQVIVMVIGALFLGSVVIFALERNNPFYIATFKSKRVKHNCYNYMCGFQSLYGSLSYLFGVLLNEGNMSLHEPKSLTGRTFFSCWCLFSMVIVGTYSGNLIAFLTVTKEVRPFDSLTELAKKNDYKWGTIGGTLWEQFFMSSDIPSFKSVGDGIRQFNKSDPGVLSKSSAYHINRVKMEDNYAFLADDGSINLAIAKDCRLAKIKERFLPLTEAFGFPDRSPHVRIFAEKLMYMHESGLIKEWKRKWWRSSRTCDGSITTNAKPIEVLDVQAAFYLAAGGITLSIVAFCVELILPKLRPHKFSDSGTNLEIELK